MTALVYLKTPAAMHLMTDGAHYDAEGVMVGTAPKVAVLDDIGMAIFTRGPAGAANVAAAAWRGRFASYDDFAAYSVDHVRDFYHASERYMRGCGHPDLELYFFGWSAARGRFEGTQIRCAYSDSAMLAEAATGGRIVLNPPFVPHELKVFGMAPGVFTKDNLATARFPITGKTAKWIPEVDLLQVLEMIRRKPEARFPGQPLRIHTGGHAMLTTIAREGIRQKIVAEFPDQIGRPIEPPPPVNWKRWREEAMRRFYQGRAAERRAA